MRSVIDELETRYPMLSGTIRDYATQQRRPFLRFFACKEDYSLEPLDTLLPESVVSGKEPFIILGAIAGGWYVEKYFEKFDLQCIIFWMKILS